MSKYSIGVDYGTLSGRAVLVNVETGEELASSVYEYPHAVMDEKLPSGKKLGHDWALEHPQDYIDVLANTIPAVLKESGVSPDDVIGIGTDFTACTLVACKADGTPLCFLPEFKDEPHAYVKLWKHHAAQDKANKLNEIARERGEKWLDNYGEKFPLNGLFQRSGRFLMKHLKFMQQQTALLKLLTGLSGSFAALKHVIPVQLAIKKCGIKRQDSHQMISLLH